MNDQRARRGARFFDPQRAEEWKFFALVVAGADRQAARVDAIGLAARQAAKECRTLEDRQIPPALAGGPGEHAHAGKAEVRQIGRRLQLAEVVRGAIIDQALRLAILDDVQLHRRGEDETAVQRLEREAALLVVPHRRFRIAPYCRILLESEIGEHVRQVRSGRPERRLGEVARHVENIVRREWTRRPQRLGARARAFQRRAPGCERGAEGQFEEISSPAACHDALRSRFPRRPQRLTGPPASGALCFLKPYPKSSA